MNTSGIYEPAPVPSVWQWEWLLSIFMKAADQHLNVEIDKLSADEHEANFEIAFWEVSSPQAFIRGLRAAADAMEKAIS